MIMSPLITNMKGFMNLCLETLKRTSHHGWCSELDAPAAVEFGSVSDDSAENKVKKTARPD